MYFNTYGKAKWCLTATGNNVVSFSMNMCSTTINHDNGQIYCPIGDFRVLYQMKGDHHITIQSISLHITNVDR